MNQQERDAIAAIEKQIGVKLKECPSNRNYIKRNEYRLNKYGEVIDLDLNENSLYDIDALKGLTNLVELNLSVNKISDIDALKGLTNLKKLSLAENQLSDVSALKRLTNITWLDLDGNQLSDMSALKGLTNLTELSLRENQLSELPEWFLDWNLPIKLDWGAEKGIFVGGNPFTNPPIEIIEKGNDAIRDYFNQLKKEDSDYIYEAKLILVGEGGSGKTSLANKIINPDWELIPENESESTRGIDILRYEFPFKDKKFRVNIWDFGGQEIYHQTHQFFLTKRSLYLLLADNRKEDGDFYYWLNTVSMLSEASPLLIIKNEKGDRQRQLPESELRAEFNNLKESLATNLKDNRGLDIVINKVQHFLQNLPHIGSPLPKTWIRVREALENNPENTMSLKDYFKLCQENGFTEEAHKKQLSGYLHDLGVCLHFQDNPLLNNTLILKPTWATDAVYKVLDNKSVIANWGRFNQSTLQEIWKDEQYCYVRGELLELMKNFNLCYEIPNQKNHYISPQLLSAEKPTYQWQEANNLLLRYKYEFMPKGIISQLIVKMHHCIADEYTLVWKTGVVLEKDNAKAEVIEYYGKREIHVRALGEGKKELLSIISGHLDDITQSYKGLKGKYQKLVPCNCTQCVGTQTPHFFQYANLQKRRDDGKFKIQCDKSYQEVSVLKLLDDIKVTNQIKTDEQGGLTAGRDIIINEKDSLFQKPLFWLGVAAFLYFSFSTMLAYNLKKDGEIEDVTFSEIVLAPLKLLKLVEKK
ncbi:MAG: hypothetical protein RIR79_1911 [Pseudomonadota bacterium]|jgi:Leucine-rich repeat (LRR) protein